MALATVLRLLLAGGCIGVTSGLLGIGGGVLVIPVLVLIFGFAQQRAVGTSLAMLLPPIGVLAVLRYARAGQVDWSAAMIMAAAFAVGASLGAYVVTKGWISERALRYVFVAFLLYIAGSMLFRGERRVWAALCTVGLGGVYTLTYWAMRALGKRWERDLRFTTLYREQLDAPMAPEYEI
jgi:uncharacterized membrane protein YfcA